MNVLESFYTAFVEMLKGVNNLYEWIVTPLQIGTFEVSPLALLTSSFTAFIAVYVVVLAVKALTN